MRLVKSRKTTLSAEDTRKLYDKIDSLMRRDDEFFKRVKAARLWLRNLREKKKKDYDGNYPMVSANLAYAHVKTLLTELFIRDPSVKVNPVQPKHEESAPVWEDLIQLVIRRTGYKKETKETVFASEVYPESWKKWVFSRSAASEDIESGEARLERGGDSQGVLSETNKEGLTTWDTMDTPIGVRLCPSQVIVDSEDRSLDNANMVVVRYRKKLRDLILDDRYPNITKDVRARLRAPDRTASVFPVVNKVERSDFEDRLKGEMVGTDDEVILYECWIYQDTELGLYRQVVSIVEDYLDAPAREPTPWETYIGPHVRGWPFNRLVLNPVPDDIPLSELGLFRSLQESINWVLERLVAKVENQKLLYNFYPQNAKNPSKAKEQFYSGRIREAVESANEGKVFEAEPMVGGSRDDYTIIQILQSFLQQITGVGQNRRGSAGIRTATEAAIIEQSAAAKLEEKADTVMDFIRRDMEIMSCMLREVVPGDFVFKVVGDRGPVRWRQFTKIDAEWSPDIEIEPASFRKNIQQERVANLAQAFQFAAQLYPLFPDRIQPQVILRRLLTEMQIEKVSEIVQSGEDPVAKQLSEIVLMVVTGQMAPVYEQDNHVAEITTIDNLINIRELFNAMPGEAQNLILEHRQQHEDLLQGIQQKANQTRSTADPLEQGNGEMETANQGSFMGPGEEEDYLSRGRL